MFMPARNNICFVRLYSAFAILVTLFSLSIGCFAQPARNSAPLAVGENRELFVDRHLIDSITGARLMLHEPCDRGNVFAFDKPWEGRFCAYCTMIHDGNIYRLYYRGKPAATPDGRNEATCVAESDDGIHWTRPILGLVEFDGSRSNNIIQSVNNLSHNFSPMLDANPAASPDQRYKALCGTMATGLFAFTSPDGLHWKKLQNTPVFNDKEVRRLGGSGFDSQNVAFWSTAEKRYLMFFRVNKNHIRRIARAESEDFLHWTNAMVMEYVGEDGKPTVIEHLYINQTQPYFRASQIYVSTAARFMPGRQVISDEEARAIHVDPHYFHDTSDAIFMTSRGGNIYNRTFLSSFIRAGIGANNWVSRTTYPALNVVQTGPTEMSVYANQDYAQPTAHLERYSLRLDGFASVHAPYSGGEMVTKPLIFDGNRLLLNFATSAAGGIRVEIQNAEGKPLPGFSLADSVETIGNEIERAVRWKGGRDVSALAGQPIRLRFLLKDADLYAIQFAQQ